MRFTTPEREAGIEEAIGNAYAAVRDLGLKAEVETLGLEPQTVRVLLVDSFSRIESIGMGKGLDRQALASGLFEALEHYYLKSQLYEETCVWVSSDDVASQVSLARTDVARLLQARNNASRVPCRQYECLTTPGERLDYPLALSLPDYIEQPFEGDDTNYSVIAKLGTNNGSAAGSTRVEAVLHAVNELIERHSISRLLTDLFVTQPAMPLPQLDLCSLPTDLFDLADSVKDLTEIEPVIVHMINEFSLPSFMVVLKQESIVIPHIGAGCSPMRDYALERALLEALQVFRAHGEGMERANEKILRTFKGIEVYRKAASLDLAEHFSLGAVRDVDYGAVGSPMWASEEQPEAYLEHLLRDIARAGFDVFVSDAPTRYSQVRVVHCVVPGLDHFHLVMGGMPVLPVRL